MPSDAETVLDEDSPLSPCIWTHTAAVDATERQQPTAEPCALLASTPASSRGDSALQPPRTELRLSPASQLNVLSQISELADVQPQLSTATAAARSSRQAHRAHVWASSSTAKRLSDTNPNAPSNPKAKKKQKKKQPTRTQAERLVADRVDWETCSAEGGLFAGDGDDLDEWVNEDISDSDFEA